MTDIEQKALALINAEIDYDPTANDAHEYKALCRAIEQHEAFRQEVSDAVVEYFGPKHLDVILAGHLLSRFIIPATKPDQLVEVLKDFGGFMPDADDFRAALEARGLEIRTKAND